MSQIQQSGASQYHNEMNSDEICVYEVKENSFVFANLQQHLNDTKALS